MKVFKLEFEKLSHACSKLCNWGPRSSWWRPVQCTRVTARQCKSVFAVPTTSLTGKYALVHSSTFSPMGLAAPKSPRIGCSAELQDRKEESPIKIYLKSKCIAESGSNFSFLSQTWYPENSGEGELNIRHIQVQVAKPFLAFLSSKQIQIVYCGFIQRLSKITQRWPWSL